MDITDKRVIILTAYSLLLGIALGCVWVLFSFVRIVLSPSGTGRVDRTLRALAAFFTDYLYSIFSAICVVLLFFSANSCRVRLLGLCGCFFGTALFHVLLGRRILLLLARTVGAVRAFLGFLYRRTLGIPLRFLAGKICLGREKRRRKKAERKKVREKKKILVEKI